MKVDYCCCCNGQINGGIHNGDCATPKMEELFKENQQLKSKLCETNAFILNLHSLIRLSPK